MSRAEPQRGGRGPGPLRLAFTQTVQVWYYGLVPFAVLNLVWLLCVATVVAGPPATAALLLVARDAAIGQGAEPSSFFYYLRRYFWRAWAFGLFSALGTIIFVFDLRYYVGGLGDNEIALSVGIIFLTYVLLVWQEFLLIAWPLLVNQPEMSLRDVARNAFILTMRVPGANLGLILIINALCIICIFLAPLIGLALAAFICLLSQHYLHIQAPVLANFPPSLDAPVTTVMDANDAK